jgi:cyclopropane fatty-acyl-phospholipid synthase-like methyltransferase
VEQVHQVTAHMAHSPNIHAVGHVSYALLPYVRQVVGIDSSQRMVDQYNATAAQRGLHAYRIRAIQAELQSGLQEHVGQEFDIAVVSPQALSALE